MLCRATLTTEEGCEIKRPNDAGSRVGKERGGWRLYTAGALPRLPQSDGRVQEKAIVTQPLVGSTGYDLRVPSLPHSSSGLDLSFILHQECS